MDLDIVNSRDSLKKKDIVKFEEEFGITLPEEYKNFLMVHNGGRPKQKIFPIQNNPSDTHAYIDFFLCLKEKDVYEIATWINRYQLRIPHNMIPIAVDPGGNLICLSVSGTNSGKVYYWEHEYEVEGGIEPWDKNLYPVASSFLEFIKTLT